LSCPFLPNAGSGTWWCTAPPPLPPAGQRGPQLPSLLIAVESFTPATPLRSIPLHRNLAGLFSSTAPSLAQLPAKSPVLPRKVSFYHWKLKFILSSPLSPNLCGFSLSFQQRQCHLHVILCLFFLFPGFSLLATLVAIGEWAFSLPS